MTSFKDLIPGAVRGFLSVGGWAHLMSWTRRGEERNLALGLSYPNGQAQWRLTVTERGRTLYEGTETTLEPLCIQAVATLGVTS